MVGYIFGGNTGETPQSIARKREIARALMGRMGGATTIGDGIADLGAGIAAGIMNARAGAAERRGMQSAALDFAPFASFGSDMPAASPSASPTIADALPGSKNAPSPSNQPPIPGIQQSGVSPLYGDDGIDVAATENYIRKAAADRGIDPDVAVRVARSEGLAPNTWQSNVVKDGRRETSYGPFQLLVGGGLGDEFQKVYGKSPSDPSTVQNQIDFALDKAAQGGWSPWYGAAKVGVGERTGLERARALGYRPASSPNSAADAVTIMGQGGRNGASREWIRYANEGAVRNKPINEKLSNALGFLPELGVTMEVFSGGQDASGPNRTGSHRHDDGGAADVFFYKDGKRLDWANENDRPIFEDIVRRGKAAGVTGFGAGEGYMQPGSMHIGFGSPAVWGAGGRSANAPEWLRNAYNSEYQPPLPMPGMPQQPNAAVAPPVDVAAGGGRKRGGIIDALMASTRQQEGPGADYFPAAPNPAGQPGVSRQQIIRALTNPFASPEQRAIAQDEYQRMRQQADPAYQMQMERNRLELEQLRNPQAKVPDSVRALQMRAEAAGLKPGTKEYSEFMLSGGDKGITVDARQMGNIPPGYKADYDANGNVISLSPIPGSPADVEAQAARDKKQLGQNMQAGKADVVTQDIDRAIEVMGSGTLPDTGVGALLSSIPGTDAKRLSGLLDTIKANVSFDTLNQMRQASPTGGALGSVTENELKLLQSAIGSLDQSQDAATLKDNLNRVWNMYQDTVHGPGMGPSRRPLSFDKSASSPSQEVAPPAGIDKELWDVMTPEEKALWR